MKFRGEITVFLSLVIVCVMSLILGLLESARTAGARQYGQMAADSAMASVMSCYNENLWGMYRLLFLEAESDEAVEQMYTEYLKFYVEQKNLYPMKPEMVKLTEKTEMVADGGRGLEDSALSFVKYRLPEVAENLTGIADDAAASLEAGDFQTLFEVCREAGWKTRKLEKSRRKVEECLEDILESQEELLDAAESGARGRFETVESQLEKEYGRFKYLVDAYEEEIQNLSEYKTEPPEERSDHVTDYMDQELSAYEDVEKTARQYLSNYRKLEKEFRSNERMLEEALDVLEEERYETIYVDGIEERVPIGPDWDAVCALSSQLECSWEKEKTEIDWEKVSLLDRLEEVLQGDLLSLVLPQNVEVSKNTVSLRGIPSKNRTEAEDGDSEDLLSRFLIGEYCVLFFDSYRGKSERPVSVEEQPLRYEVEYLLSGKSSDRENLVVAVEKLLALRGGMNLLCLLSDPEKKAEAESLALAVSGGNASLMVILTFLISVMWAFGEAVFDLKQLMNRGSVPFQKPADQWKLDMEALLALQFLEPATEIQKEGKDYLDHIRILLFLAEREERNFRMMDMIQWNVRTVQKDFSVEDCFCEAEISTDIREKHLFFINGEYKRTFHAVGRY